MLERPPYRPDIDGLRAIAVLAVVGFHAFPEAMPGGFVGVDVFFVVSGFLISSLILGSLARGNFGFAEFYARRVRRILPALIVVLAAAYAFAWFALLPAEFLQLGKHVAAGAGFASNFVLWQEGGYFDEPAALKPLLHLWSLAIEEQYYMFWPLLLWLGWKRRPLLFPITLLIAGISLAYNLGTVGGNATAAFFSPLSRFFELLAGSALAVLALDGRDGTWTWWHGAAAALGLLLIAAALMMIDSDRVFPGAWVLLPTVGTCLVIRAGPDAWPNRKVLANRALVWLGLISYPLYLWHWPMLSFARIVERGEPGFALRFAIVAASVLLAWLTYVLVEKPIRFGARGGMTTALLCAILLAAGLAGYGTYLGDGLFARGAGQSARNLMRQAEWPYWTSPECVARYAASPCQASGERPRFMILGDSHANHLFPGLAFVDPAFGVVQVGNCPPLEGVRLHVQKNQDRHPCAGTDYLELNKRILVRQPDIRTVFLATLWRNVLTGEFVNAREKASWGAMTLVPADPADAGKSNQDLVLLGLSRTIAWLRARGLRVVLVRDTPDVRPALVEYCRLGPRFSPSECTLQRQEYLDSRRHEDGLLRALRAKFPDLAVYDPIDALCDQASCYLIHGDELLYRDHHHLSVNGSRRVAADLKKWLATNQLLD